MTSRFFIDTPNVREYYQWDGNLTEAQDYLDRSGLATNGGYTASVDGDTLVLVNNFDTLNVLFGQSIKIVMGMVAVIVPDTEFESPLQQEVSNSDVVYVVE